MDLQKIFGKFAGKEINVIETKRKVNFPNLGIIDEIWTECDLNEKEEPTLKELYNTASKYGLNVRTWLPGWGSTHDYAENRLNVYIEKEADGKYRIQNEFRIG